MEGKVIRESSVTAHAQSDTQKKKAAKPKSKPPKRSVAPGRQTGSEEARKCAAAVLEVLAGERRPTEAAGVLGVSLMRYYVVESRALQGLVEGCEPRPKGPRVNPARQVAKLMRRIERLERDAWRYQALARASHRTIGIAPVKTTRPRKGKPKRRKPTVRALKAARGLRAAAAVEQSPEPTSPSVAAS